MRTGLHAALALLPVLPAAAQDEDARTARSRSASSPDGRLRFHLLALWKGNWKEYSPNISEAGGTVPLEKNRAVYREEGCVLAMTFTSDTLKIHQEGDCGFGHNVQADGTYRRMSLCAAPEAGEE